MLAQIKKNDDVKRAYGRMFAYDVPSENSGKATMQILFPMRKINFNGRRTLW